VKPGPPVADEPGEPGPKKPREFVVTRPVGTWVREIVAEGGSIRMTLKIDEDRVTVVSEQAGGPHRVTITAEADYAINKESILYGVITSMDVDGAIPDKDLLTYEQAGIGQPFAVRFRLEGDSLTLKDFRGFGVGMHSGQEADAGIAMICGRYVKSDGKAPAKPATRRLRGGDPLIAPPTRGRSDAGPSSSSHLQAEPPADRDVLKALPRPARGVPYAHETFRDDVVIVKDRIASKTETPRFYPYVGPARLNKSQWECKVYFTETTTSGEPFPAVVKKPRVQTVYLDTEQLASTPGGG
jgi:hypothetical protein